MTNETLASYANLSVYSAMAVFTLAMIGYAVYLAGLVPNRGRVTQPADAVVASAPAGSAHQRGGGEDAPTGATLDRTDAPGAGASPSGGDDETTPLRARKAAGIAETLTWLGTFLLVMAVVLRGLSVHRAPLGNMFEFATVGSMFVMLAYCGWSLRGDLRWLGLFVVGPVLLTLGLATTVWYTEAAQLLPSLQSYWLVIHVTVATISVAVFTLGFSVTILYLIQDRVERDGRTSFMNRLPDAASLERLSYGIHIVAFPLWTFTLIAGAIWARQAWGSYWNWDPKEVWTFVIWVVYAAYLHARATSGWSRQSAALIALAGFACIIINYGVVNVFFVSQHSYSGL
jgi:cytochrome c-type biogenesis protein CcsB